MPGLRLDRLIALIGFCFLLLLPRGAVSGSIADADEPVPNAEVVGPPAEVDPQRAAEKPAGSDAKISPIPSTTAAPAADDKSGESSNQADALRPAILGGPLPTAEHAEAASAGIATPTPTPNSDQPSMEASAAVIATPAPIPTANSDKPNMEVSPVVVAPPAPTPTANSDQPIVQPSPAVAATPTPKANPDTLATEPEVPAAAGLRPEKNSQSPAASDNHPVSSTTTVIPAVAPSQTPATDNQRCYRSRCSNYRTIARSG